MAIIDKVIFILTPYHAKSLEILEPGIISSKSTLVIKASYLKLNYETKNLFDFDSTRISRLAVLKKPISGFNKLKKDIKEIENEIEILANKFNLSNSFSVYLGNDKDIFTQIFLLKISDSIDEVIAIDEGLGFYVNVPLKYKFYECLYPVITKILLGNKIHFIKRLGTHPMISIVYLRDMELLQSKSLSKKYKPFKTEIYKVNQTVNFQDEILIYSFPEQDLGISTKEKVDFLIRLVDALIKKGKNAVIKPHPREVELPLIEAFQNNDFVKVLDSSFLGEELNYFDFEIIVNFFSSVILDIVSAGYPKFRVVTIGFQKKSIISFDKELKYHYIKEFNSEKILNDFY